MSDVPRKRDGSVASVSDVVEKKNEKVSVARNERVHRESVRLFLFVYY